MSTDDTAKAECTVITTDFARLNAWRKNAILLASEEMLAQQLGHTPQEGERVLLRELHNLEAYAHLTRGELDGQLVWFADIEPETVRELDASDALAEFWAAHRPQTGDHSSDD